ncbi:MAG: twin-arginine translocation signal domain-containing protein [Candidatus Saccharicenans sp.]
MKTLKRRDFLKISAGSGVALAITPELKSPVRESTKTSALSFSLSPGLGSPGGRTKVKVARIYMGLPRPH